MEKERERKIRRERIGRKRETKQKAIREIRNKVGEMDREREKHNNESESE